MSSLFQELGEFMAGMFSEIMTPCSAQKGTLMTEAG
jgi:hypothetical protein